jgi:hypothetical protein
VEATQGLGGSFWILVGFVEAQLFWLPLLEHMLTDWKRDIMELGVAIQEVQYMLNEPVLV